LGEQVFRDLNELIRHIVDCRFAVQNVANTVIQAAHKGESVSYRGHVWGKEHIEAMERVHLAVEAAFSYAKWLQWPEAKYRLDEGSAQLAGLFTDPKSSVPLLSAVAWESQLVTSEPQLDQRTPVRSVGTDISVQRRKELIMATVAGLQKVIEDLQEEMQAQRAWMEEQVSNLNDQLSELERGVDHAVEAAESKDGRKKRVMSDEQRKEAGRRLQQARANKLGLQSIEQLHALKLRPGQQPTRAQITKVKKELPVKS
jgi:hypothetical protein